MGVSTSEVIVEPAGESSYSVSLKNVPGLIKVDVPENNMSAVIRLITPPSGDGPWVTIEYVEQALANLKVTFGIDREAIEKVVSEVSSTKKPQKNIAIASGEATKNGSDAVITFKIGRDAENKDPQACNIVRPDQVIAVKTPATRGKNGKNVIGKEMPAKPGKDIDFRAGENVLVSKDKTSFVSKIYGRVEFKENRVSVKRLVQISDDGMIAQIGIFPRVSDNSLLTLEDVLGALKSAGVVHGIKEDVIEAALKEDKNQEKVLVASGEATKNGSDAVITFKIGRDAENKDPQACNIVRPDQVIAVKTPATRGKNGKNVIGKEMPAKPGKDIDFRAGENVLVSKDKTSFVSKIYGRVEFKENRVSVKRLVQISDDGMIAQIGIFPRVSDNSLLTLEDVLGALKSAGVVHGIKKEFISTALKSGKPIERLTVAEASPFKDGIDAKVEYKFLLNGEDPEIIDAQRSESKLDENSITKEIVFAGDVLAIRTPVQPQEDGRSVTGKVLSGALPKDKTVGVGENVALLDDGKTYVVAEGMGYSNLVNGNLCVERPIPVSEDKMRVYLCIHPPSKSGKVLSRDMVIKELKDRGITCGIDAAAIEEAFKQAAKMTKPLCDIPIAEGVTPQKGEDAQIEFSFQPEIAPGTMIEGIERMDFKERGMIHMVKTGDLLAVKTPVKPGVDGVDVFGEPIPAENGEDKALKPAGNVRVSEDGLTFTAEIDGMGTLIGKDRLAVFTNYVVPGDVDYSTGNLSMDGTLDIKGWIRSGFAVNASADIRVSGGIEDANVEAGNNIYVNGGILGSGERKIKAGGDLTARFLENAVIQADGDVVIHGDALRSTVFANGSVLITEGKGRIRGGSIYAMQKIEANEIGSEFGVRTVVGVGPDLKIRKRIADIKRRLSGIKRATAQIHMASAAEFKKSSKKTIQDKKTPTTDMGDKLRRERVIMENRLAKYKEELAQILSKVDEQRVTVKTKRAVFFGTIVVMRGYAYHVKDDVMGKVKFVWNEEKQVVELVN